MRTIFPQASWLQSITADDIGYGCPIDEYSENSDPDWERKYIYMRWKDEAAPETEHDLRGGSRRHHERPVIHTPGQIWRGGNHCEVELLVSCYRSCLEIAAAHGIRSVAFPSISTGVYSYPLEEAAKVAVKTAKEFVAEHPSEIDRILWALFDEKTYAAYQREIDRLKSA